MVKKSVCVYVCVVVCGFFFRSLLAVTNWPSPNFLTLWSSWLLFFRLFLSCTCKMKANEWKWFSCNMVSDQVWTAKIISAIWSCIYKIHFTVFFLSFFLHFSFVRMNRWPESWPKWNKITKYWINFCGRKRQIPLPLEKPQTLQFEMYCAHHAKEDKQQQQKNNLAIEFTRSSFSY